MAAAQAPVLVKLVKLKVRDISHGSQIASRAIVMQKKTKRPVEFEITESTRKAVRAWIDQATLKLEDALEMAEQTKV